MENKNPRTQLENRKVVLSAALIAVLVVVSVLNQNMFSPAQSTPVPVSMGRGLASVESPQVQTEWEYKLAKQMAQSETDGTRDMASIGQMPSPIEQFRFGLLENKYQFNFDEGKIASLTFPESSPDRPKYITEGKDFVLQHSGLFKVAFKGVKTASKETEGENVRETLNLLDGDQKAVGKAVVVTDQYGRLLSLQIDGL
ncbi:MAG TPA: hypothetical protein VFV50_00440 [Bdellovibrionales bacterium]|nr:hypothetical protein [Bdellovibrionales bacterium]